MKRFFGLFLFLLLLAGALVGLNVWNTLRTGGTVQIGLRNGGSLFGGGGGTYTLAQSPTLDLKSTDALAAMSRQRIALAKAVVPSVVSITTTRSLPPQQRQMLNDPVFRHFFGGGRGGPGNGGGGNGDESGVAQRALGSGVIVTKEGHIVTNNHVVENMDQFEIELSDGRREKAKLIGTDPATDLAVLQIENKDIAPISFGDSDKVEVGETVLAVGNPYGLEETVTQGIISAKGRSIGAESLNEFFQTDAAINPGNSGGALINVAGELIGINAAIYSQSGGFQGVGFAIPANVARRVLDSLVKNGRVVRGFLGVTLRTTPLSQAAVKQMKLPSELGALIEGVANGSPADKAGLKAGDFIQKFNSRVIKTVADLRRAVAEVAVNTSVPIEYVRDGRTETANAEIVEQSRSAQASNQPRQGGGGSGGDNDNNAVGNGVLAGVEVTDLTPALSRRLALPGNVGGVVVTGVSQDSPASDDLQPGDVIEEINRQEIRSTADFRRAASALPAGRRVTVSIIRERARSFVVLGP
ncbi:MAG: Do family serine endopeptidase [Verrucomicrobia bacterium]|nr:Do family serine endopeptidase [Verrucomicrobiota bacterium]MBV9656695.1 Do family serine endopeptidase [Verrucomicrobiota bacterium]